MKLLTFALIIALLRLRKFIIEDKYDIEKLDREIDRYKGKNYGDKNRNSNDKSDVISN